MFDIDTLPPANSLGTFCVYTLVFALGIAAWAIEHLPKQCLVAYVFILTMLVVEYIFYYLSTL